MLISTWQYIVKCKYQFIDTLPSENSNRVIHDQVKISTEGHMTKWEYQTGSYMTKCEYQHGHMWPCMIIKSEIHDRIWITTWEHFTK